MKKGIKLTTKIVLITLFPLVLISVIAVMMGTSGERNIAYQLVEENLENVAYSVDNIYNLYEDGDFSYQNGIFKKGLKKKTR